MLDSGVCYKNVHNIPFMNVIFVWGVVVDRILIEAILFIEKQRKTTEYFTLYIYRIWLNQIATPLLLVRYHSLMEPSPS
jgi:hypothetical protein